MNGIDGKEVGRHRKRCRLRSSDILAWSFDSHEPAPLPRIPFLPLFITVIMVQSGTHKTQDGAQIAYRIHGSAQGTPLVLIMGLSGIMEDWSPLVEELAKTRRILISDHRGIGSSKIPQDWDYELTHDVMVDDILEVLVSLGTDWSQVDFLGWSMGGHILQRMTTRPEASINKSTGAIQVHPRVSARKLILTATCTRIPRGDLDINAMQERISQIKDPQQRKEWATKEMMSYQYDPTSLEASSDLKAIMDHRIKVSMTTRRPQDIIGLQAMAMRGYKSKDDLHRIPESVPVLVIHGKKDRMVHYAESEPIMANIRHAKRVDLTDGSKEAQEETYGHFWFDYFGTSFWVKKINAFLDQSSTSRNAKL